MLVTGSRDLTDELIVRRALYEHGIGRYTIVVGDCPTGADLFAANYSSIYGYPIEVHRADWDAFGKAAGPRRNKAMVDSGADACLAFFKGDPDDPRRNRGTRNCVAAAQQAGIRVVRFVEP